MKKLFYDLETTGVNHRVNAIHQIAMLVDIDGQVEERLDWKIAPFEGSKIDDKALEIGRVTLEQIQGYPTPEEVFKNLIRLLNKYVDRYDKHDKFHLVGYNNRYFDDHFLRSWFERMGDVYFGSWFWADSLDVMVLASQFLSPVRSQMPNFKLATVAAQLGIESKEEKYHDGVYDVQVTREIYKAVTEDDILA